MYYHDWGAGVAGTASHLTLLAVHHKLRAALMDPTGGQSGLTRTALTKPRHPSVQLPAGQSGDVRPAVPLLGFFLIRWQVEFPVYNADVVQSDRSCYQTSLSIRLTVRYFGYFG